MPQLKVNVTNEEVKAVEGIVMDAEEWLQAAWDGKVEHCLHRVIEEYSDKNPAKMTKAQRKALVEALPVIPRKDKPDK